jgi:hypothetical protein
MTTHEQSAHSPAGLLERQHELLTALVALSRRQGELIDAEDDAGVLAVLAERQPMVEELVALNDLLRPHRAAWDRRLAALPAPQRDHVVRRSELVAALARTLASRDEADRRRLARRRDDLADELAALGTRRGALSAYRAVVPGGPAYQDREA